ncbi:MAG: SRPBCC domain-containing protein [Microbacteriaceae bacterium]|nr:SRPBCC domain-containing protein [Microbacteriaceae bacterium]
MSIVDIITDPKALTMTVLAEFSAPVERLWRAYTSAEQLGRFWGPPGWPATFTKFDLNIGGTANYRMTGPDGESSCGYWEFVKIEEPKVLELLDGFSDEDGNPVQEMPSMRMRLEFEATVTGSKLMTISYFPSVEALEQLLAMGVVEGLRGAMGQLDAVLQDLREYAQGKGTRLEMLDEQRVRITRLVNGSRDLVWRAHTEPELIRKWMYGPDGWRMTDCQIDPRVGGKYRWAWEPENVADGDGFAFEGEFSVFETKSRMVASEQMVDTDYPATQNDTQFYEEQGVTLITTIIVYPDAATRDQVLATGMIDGMESNYARLEQKVLNS